MALAIVLVICATVIAVSYMFIASKDREVDLLDQSQDIALLRSDVDKIKKQLGIE